MDSLCERLRREWYEVEAEYSAASDAEDDEATKHLRSKGFAIFQDLMAANANSIEDCIAKIDILGQEAFLEPAGDALELAIRSGWASLAQGLERLRFMSGATKPKGVTEQ
jgi:hypothetical protein